MINGQKDTYDYVAEAVREYWGKTHPQDMVAFFEQKYESFDLQWEKHEEIVMWCGDYTERMEFLNDFNEGQTMIRNLKVVPLLEVLEYYRKEVIENGE